jgi:hypothetical protein
MTHAFHVTISVNKVIFGQNLGAFPCPLLLTSVHFFVQWMFSYTVSSEFPDFFGGTAVENMSWSTFLGEFVKWQLCSIIGNAV